MDRSNAMGSEPKYFISCYNQDTRLIDSFEVPHSVYVYIIQLETYIVKLEIGLSLPEKSRLKELYTHRFKPVPVE